MPFGLLIVRIQAEGHALTQRPLVVAVEDEAIPSHKRSIGALRPCEITRRARRRAVYPGIFLVLVGCVVGRAVATNESDAAVEHVGRGAAQHARRVPVATHIDCLQIAAALEYAGHIRNPLHREARQVKLSQCRASGKHLRHVGDLLCVERDQIEFCQARTALEHLAHVRNAVGRQILVYPTNVAQVRHVGKPHTCASGMDVGKLIVEIHPCDFGTLCCPSGRCRACLADVVDRACLAKLLKVSVVAEEERAVGDIGVGLGFQTEVARLRCALVDAGISLVVGVARVVAGV